MNHYKALFFDIDDTLFDYGKCSETALKNTCRRMGHPFSKQLLLFYRQLDDALWTLQKQGQLTIPQVIRKRGFGMAEKMGDLNSNPNAAEKFIEIFGDELGNTFDLVDGAHELLEYASHKGYALFCASNGVKSMQINRLKQAGLLHYFQYVFVSDEVGFEKPDSHFFDHCLNGSGYTKQEALMIGDSLTADIQGAINAGWEACFFNRRNITPPVACLQIRRLMELKAIF